ncbi:hypothetical protein AWY96_00800 [Serratia plymuthica]|uniref:hypothetical protein n=1 Tax=Serratia plymuthica TaxID=82996 RepID=UPI0007A0AB35|nr:hypothetical protein [Serratia plymuthica]KYQ97111.1 hypothetical protein AWY96_00800 [Serratia plymuthica]
MSGIISSELESIIGLLLAVSIASERLVEIIKGYFPWLNEEKQNPVSEGRRKSALQILAVAAGIVTAFLAQPILADSLSSMNNQGLAILSVGLLASGGSAFWNAILSYMLQVKNLKKQEVKASSSQNSETPNGIYQDLDLGEEQVSSNECYDPEEK